MSGRSTTRAWAGYRLVFWAAIAAVAALSAVSPSHAESDSASGTFTPPFKTAIIISKWSGGNTARETAYVDWPNRRVAFEGSMTDAAGNTILRWWQIFTSDTHYSVDMEKQEVTRAAWPTSDDAFRINFAMSPPDHPTGEEVIAGRTCQLGDWQGTTYCIWQGMPLLITRKPEGSWPGNTKRVVEIRADVALPEDKFTPPVSMRVVDAPPSPRTARPILGTTSAASVTEPPESSASMISMEPLESRVYAAAPPQVRFEKVEATNDGLMMHVVLPSEGGEEMDRIGRYAETIHGMPEVGDVRVQSVESVMIDGVEHVRFVLVVQPRRRSIETQP